ncbi:MAG: hypothetical protein IJ146_00800 [Kiritimatiellae bacterium]|nr:hypothetical protein [Kiritimatiellia bacterium]
MKKVAIVGVEGSGKTVMLAGLGDLYTYPGTGWKPVLPECSTCSLALLALCLECRTPAG